MNILLIFLTYRTRNGHICVFLYDKSDDHSVYILYEFLTYL